MAAAAAASFAELIPRYLFDEIPELEEEGEEDESGSLEPFFFDEAEAERRRAREEEAAREKERAKARAKAREEELARQRKKEKKILRRIREYEPKLGRVCYTRIHDIVNLHEFDLDEESPLGPMRYTDNIYKEDDMTWKLCTSVNILSVKIVSSDVGFPINVHGTVIARDYIDNKCVFLFRRHRDDAQLITSKDESLILTGPTRGLTLVAWVYLEVNLKIKDDQKKKDRELSKGLLVIDGVQLGFSFTNAVRYDILDSKLSDVEVKFAVLAGVVEATVEAKVVEGLFCGEISACFSSIQDRFVLLDGRESTGGMMTTDDGILQLSRRVIVVPMKEALVLTFVNQDESTETVDFTPRLNGASDSEIKCGGAKILVKVAWSYLEDY